jgi:hypothetical protein
VPLRQRQEVQEVLWWSRAVALIQARPASTGAEDAA